MNQPLVSVIVPTYNRANVLLRSLQSILSQNYHRIEVIVIDDGSTDGTKALVDSIKDNRVRYIYQENSGANVARNRGIALSSGELVAFQDSDDVWRQGKLTKQVNRLMEDAADFSICSMLSHQIDGLSQVVPSGSQIAKGLNLEIALGNNFISTQMLVVKRELISNLLFDVKMPRLQDWDLAIRLLLNGKLSYIDDILVDQYIQNDSITLKPEKLVAAYELLANKYSALYDEYPNSYSAFYTGFSGAYLLNGQYDKALNAARRSLAKKLTLKGAIRYLQAMLTSVTRWGGIV